MVRSPEIFVIVREKMGNVYLSGEYHWDANGTAKPFVLVGALMPRPEVPMTVPIQLAPDP